MNKILFEDFPKICRLCLGVEMLQPILKIKELEFLVVLTSINVKEDDKLPTNICDKCVKHVEDISAFVSTCESNDQILRNIVTQEYEKSLVVQESILDLNDNESDNCDDPKDENNLEDSFCEYKVKDFILEPDYDEADSGDEPVSCKNCSENFADPQSLDDHYKEIVMCRPIDYNIKTSSVSNILDYLKKSKKGKRTKIKKEQYEEDEPEFVKGRQLKGRRRFLCSYCGKNYTRKNGLERHILSHTGVKPFECKECGKCYITKDTLKTHLLTHTGVKTHKCTVCQKMFTQSSHLSYHMKRHSGEKPYSCTFCGKGFLSNYHLERHKLMHTGVKPYECPQCGKQFVRGTTLRDHLLIHTGEKPFQCQHCGKQFNRKQSLTNHVLVHTGYVKHSNNNRTAVRLRGSSDLLQTEEHNSNSVRSAPLNNNDGGRFLTFHHHSLTGHVGYIQAVHSGEGSTKEINDSVNSGLVETENNSIYSGSNPVNNIY